MSDTPATPTLGPFVETPWRVRDDGRSIATADGTVLTDGVTWPLQYIVLAVNSHATLLHQRDALVKALESADTVIADLSAYVVGHPDHDVSVGALAELERRNIRDTLASIKE